MANYKNLIIWQKSDKLALLIYSLTRDFPNDEQFGITSQIRRAALSVPTNIVEGYNRKSRKELGRFIDISLGSLAETEYLLEFSTKLGYVKCDTNEVESLIVELGKLLWGFKGSLSE
jgi:four helix bundle protein